MWNNKLKEDELHWIILSVLKFSISHFRIEFYVSVNRIFSWRQTKFFTRQMNLNKVKNTLFLNTSEDWRAESGGKKTTFLSLCFLIGRVFSIFWEKKDGLEPFEMNSKIINPASTFYSQTKKWTLYKWKKTISWIRRIKGKKDSKNWMTLEWKKSQSSSSCTFHHHLVK